MSFKLTVLGSGAALPTTTRNPSAMVLQMNNQHFMIDCGEGTQVQLRRFKLKFQRINHIFISHLHGDHFFGLIGLISSYHLLGRKDPLHVYADEKIRQIIEVQLEASQTQLVYPLQFHVLPASPAMIYEDDHQTVETFPLDHRVQTNGFFFREKPRLRKIKKSFINLEDVSVSEIREIKAGADYISPSGKIYPNSSITTDPLPPQSFAYCSDTRYSEEVIEHINGATLLYHEASFANDMENVAKQKFHSTAMQAATIASKAEAKQLLLGHFSARYKQIDKLLDEARLIFPETIAAEDGVTYSIGKK